MRKLQDERLSAAKRDDRLLASRMKDNRLLASRMKDNRRLASRMANIKSTVDHRNEYQLKSSNSGKRKQDLVIISEQNQAMYQRLLSRKSVYSREHWLGDWEKTERLLEHISRYPKEQAAKQRLERKEKMVTFNKQYESSRKSIYGRSRDIPGEHSNVGKRKQDFVIISKQNQAMYQRLASHKSVYSREHWLGDWEKTERLLEHISRYPKEQAAKQRLERKEKMVTFNMQDQSSSKSTSDRSRDIPGEHSNSGKRKQDLVIINEGNQAMYQRLASHKSEYSREHWLGEWEKTERILEHISRYPKEQPTKQRLERKEKQDQSSSKSTSGRSRDIPGEQ